MKKVLFIIFTLALCLFIMSFEKQSVSANTDTKGDLISSEIEYFEDGSYLVTELYSKNEKLGTRSNVRNVLHTKVVTQYSATNKVLWIYELVGGWFVEDGVSVQACSSAVHTTIESNAWSFSYGDQTYYGAVVHGGGVFKHKVLGITTKTITMDINMECDVYGELVQY